MSTPEIGATADRLNLHCHCVAVERERLDTSLAAALDDEDLVRSLQATHRHLFSSSPVFVGAGHLRAMQAVIDAYSRLAGLPAMQERVGDHLRELGLDPPDRRVPALLGFDFHLTDDGPRLIEVNTNPGGVLLALHLQNAQKACCEAVEEMERPLASPAEIEQALVTMARSALFEESGDRRPRIAIIDDQPTEQFLFPEFRLYAELFRRHELDAVIADPTDLRFDAGRLRDGEGPIDGVYNRSTDFELSQSESAALRNAWESGHVGVTPDPWAWATWADKRNLILASDDVALHDLGLDDPARNVLLTHVPRTELLCHQNADDLWTRRKSLFFKPASGHGSRGAYSGRKLTRRKFDEILSLGPRQAFVAQEAIPPSERVLLFDETERRLKLDVRCVTWHGRILMLVGRLYRGQTTNMRTEGGGLATAFVA